MATTLNAILSGSLIGQYKKTSDLTTVIEAINHTFSSSYSNGTGENQANAFYSDTRSLAGTNESFDLNAITDIYGSTLNFTSIKFMYVKNKSTTSGELLTLSGDFLASMDGGTGPTHAIGPSGIFLADNPIDGFSVVNTTQDTLTITNAQSFSYDIILLGVI